MSIIRSLARRMGYVHRADVKRIQSRAYAAAASGRLLGDWIMSPTSADADIRAGLLGVRSRARDLAQNNDLGKAYLRAIKKNVVGSAGFTLQVKAVDYVQNKPKLDVLANAILEQQFYKWMAKETATVTGKLTFRKVEELVAETVARDGEMFVRLVRGKEINRFGFSLQLVEPDWIDEKYNELLGNGHLIVMGVELNEWRKPVAYYVAKRNDKLGVWGSPIVGPPYERVPASDMLHIYDPERADQTRGMPWMASGMTKVRHTDGYVEAAVVNSRASACKMGFFSSAPGDEYTGDGKDATGNALTTAEPGTFEDIGDKTFTAYDPKYPTEQFDPFTKAMIRWIAAGLGVSYQTLSGDLGETSYASGRQGLLEERETYKTAQTFLSESFLEPVYAEWLKMALLTGAVNLPAAKYDKFNAPKWTGRRWSWVDPEKDVNAAMKARAAGFKSSTQIINDMGGDIEDTYAEIQQENELAAQHGLTLDFVSGGKGNAEQEEDSADDGKSAGGSRPGKGKAGSEDD